MLQKLWQLNITWDDEIPESLKSEYTMFRNQLSALNQLRIPRKISLDSPLILQLHGFADASLAAYGACVYVRSVGQDGTLFSSLLCAKSRVTPLKTQTIPRLELCAALLLVELVTKVTAALNEHFDTIFLWTDSSIVMHWIHTTPARLQVFVANRVSRIHELSEVSQWHHIATEDNPADILSRGTTANSLIDNGKWWRGPGWLTGPQDDWPGTSIVFDSDPPELRKTTKTITVTALISESLFERFSTLTKLKRVMAYALRFLKNCKACKKNRMSGSLSMIEMNSAEELLIKQAQAESFSIEISLLNQGKPGKIKGALKNLNPFIDGHGVLRVGGRLKNSSLPFCQKHTAVISSKHALTKLIFEDRHVKLLHAPPQLLLSSVRDSFWPLDGRSLARSTVHKCVRCFKTKPSGIIPQMGNLPKSRVEPTLPFTVTGIDFAGPFIIRDRKGRGCKHMKCYICLFICFSTKAIHLEAVTTLSTEGFMLYFKRFCSRRGNPSDMFSDNATNYIGARNELRKLYECLQHNQDEIKTQCTTDGISWHLIPPQSPHFGGLWEACVKTVKHHLRRVTGNTLFTIEEFYTLLTQIEAVVNSRPLYPMSADPTDLDVLTPSHLLIGKKLTSTPDPDYTLLNENRLSMYQRLQALQQHFWNRWSKEYIHELQSRQKWVDNQGTLQPGSLVLVKETHLPVFGWKLGRIVELFPGSDGISRVASIKTRDGVIKRAFSKICPLPLYECQ